jgi:hypothetical protein
VWVYIRKHPAEDIWEACRRVYNRDVYQVRGAGERRARCFVDASEVGNPRGFNTRRQWTTRSGLRRLDACTPGRSPVAARRRAEHGGIGPREVAGIGKAARQRHFGDRQR